jgi:hypothetical protein
MRVIALIHEPAVIDKILRLSSTTAVTRDLPTARASTARSGLSARFGV